MILLTKKKTYVLFYPILKSDGKKYFKHKKVKARIASDQEIIHTDLQGQRETTNKAIPGDYIVKNATKSKEQYIIKPEVFEKRYHKIKTYKNGWSLYQSIGEVIAVKLNNNLIRQLDLPDKFQITPDWNSPQTIGLNDYIVMPPDESEIYGIEENAFKETYRKKK